jgi:hypothetical protein
MKDILHDTAWKESSIRDGTLAGCILSAFERPRSPEHARIIEIANVISFYRYVSNKEHLNSNEFVYINTTKISHKATLAGVRDETVRCGPCWAGHCSVDLW